MIRAESKKHGVEVRLTGDATELLEELTAVIRGIKETFNTKFVGDVGELLIAYAGKLAFASEDERDGIIDEVINILEDNHVVEVVE